MDPEVRYLFVRGKIQESDYTFANTYGPNKNQTGYLIEILGKLMEFKKKFSALVQG